MTQEILQKLGSDPNVLVHQIDPAKDVGAIAAFTALDIQRASFLDQRAITQATPATIAEWSEIAAQLGQLPQNYPALIFHIGHCGSTLMSRLVEAAGGPRGVREPLPLRSFAMMNANASEGLSVWREDDAKARLDLYLRNCSIAPTAVKATSFCNNLMAPSAQIGAVNQVFFYIKQDTFIAVMLGAENNIHDLFGSIELRMRRLRHLCNAKIDDLSTMSHGEIAAAAWVCETATAAAADTAKAFEFDAFLSEPADTLFDIIDALGSKPDAQTIAKALAGPTMNQYSKAPEHQFSQATRRSQIAAFRTAVSDEIAKGRRWLETNGSKHPPIAQAIENYGN